jgi:hypothetical protein
MQMLKILFILFIMFSFGQESVKAQLPQKISYQAINGIKSNSIGNWDTIFGKGNTSGLYRSTGWVQYWIDMRERTSFDPMTINGNYYDLINKSILFNGARIKSAGKYTIMAGSGSSGTFISKWERLTGKPIYDTTSVYYYPLKRIDAPTLSDNHFYRLTGNIFNMIIDTKYPSRNAPK